MSTPKHYGLLAGFSTPEVLTEAAGRAQERGLVVLDAFTPHPVEGLPAALGAAKSTIPRWAFGGGVIGGLSILALQLYSTLIAYPIDVGGRPLASLTAFFVPTFECTVLGAALFAFVGMLAGNRLPAWYHPVFNAQSFSLADGETFYLLVDAHDPAFDRGKARRLLKSLHATSIEDVAP